jgi:hypothetical protein
MPSSEKQAGDKSHAPEEIRPGPDVEEPIDLGVKASEQRARLPTQGVRYEARMDMLLAEYKGDKTSLQAEVTRLRIQEIGHLREDVRWLEENRLGQTEALTKLRTSYESTIAFNLFSFALIVVGGAVVSYAAFVSPQTATQSTVATGGFIGLVIGVLLQAVNSYHGSQTLRHTQPARADDTRPRANPPG